MNASVSKAEVSTAHESNSGRIDALAIAATSLTDLPPEARTFARLGKAFDTWRGRLIDLSKRNRALNYRPTKVGTLTIVDEKPAEVFRLLVVEERTLSFKPTKPSTRETRDDASESASRAAATPHAAAPDPSATEDEDQLPLQPFVPYESDALEPRHTDTVLQCGTTPEGLDTSLRRLAELQRTSLEEQGVNTLYLALGFLHYKEAPQAETYLRAPLVLVPVTLERQNARAGYSLALGDDEPVLNPSLVEYLRRVHSITDLPSLPDITDDSINLDLRPFFSAVSERIAASREWRVTEDIVLATFAFQKLVIFKDLEANQQRFSQHPLVKRVVLHEGELAHDLPADIRDLDLDEGYPPESTYQVVDADSSQLRAIAAVGRQHDLVIHGPPGTGKSQTITNLIADALGRGKRVLFVSEKMAALEVVQRRLAAARLGEFCFELHSTKARKAEALEELRRSLQAHGDPSPGTPTSEPALKMTRAQLNRYAKELHKPRTSLACSAYRALGEYAKAFTAPRFAFPGDPTTLTQQDLGSILETLGRAETLGRVVEPVDGNGWRDSRLDHYSEEVAHCIAKGLDAAISEATLFDARASALSDSFGVPAASTFGEGIRLASVAGHLTHAPGMPRSVVTDAAWKHRSPEVAELLDVGRQFAKLDAYLRERYDFDRLLETDQTDVRYVEGKLSGAFGFLALLDGRYRSIRRRWQLMRLRSDAVSMLDQAADLKKFPRWKSLHQRLAAHPDAPEWFGAAWNGPGSDWDDLEARVSWVEMFHDLAIAHGPLSQRAYQIAEEGGKPNTLPDQMRLSAKRSMEALAELRRLVAWPTDYLSQDTVAGTLSRLRDLQRDLRRAPAWVAFARSIKSLSATSAHEMSEHAFQGLIPIAELTRSFMRALFSSWLERVVPGVPELEDFTTATHDETRRQFQRHDASLLKENQAKLVTLMRGMGVSRYSSSRDSHRAFLQRELAKQKRHKPLRVTLRDASEAIVALKPCFLMSPLSVSQFLAPDAVFDLVIFDEASQLPTEDAIGAICRGKQLVVVGDPKQLPPTNFFSVQIGANSEVDEDGEPLVEETESVLEEFQAAGLHQTYLEWHYRSAHEALIQFSNERFYGNRLVVFPAAAAEGPEFGLQFVYVDEGRYEGAGLNMLEAQRVAAAVVEHFRTRRHESLGVGTFNLRQQMAILDELERYRREDPSLEPCFDRSSREPFFVKNLENIQGDERDVILLSITYARQADGKLRYNFGPLNRQEGWRRLNVLVSRARKRMCVFSSLKAADINPSAVSTQGPALLRDFLEFAETGRLRVASDAGAANADSPFEFEVGETLVGMGYLVDRQVGVGSYRIDLGVRHPDRPGLYLAGIECDGAAYHMAPCARDRDRLRQQVLENRGWTILRVWSTDWFKDRAGTIERLGRTLAALRDGLQQPEVEVDPVPPAPAVPPVLEGATGGQGIHPNRPYVRPLVSPYTVASRMPVTTSSLLDAPTGTVARYIGHIVEEEGPLHVDDVVARVLYVWGHERRGTRLLDAVKQAIKRAVTIKALIRKGDFLHPQSGREVVPRSRAGMSMGAERVAPEELMATARLALAATDHIEADDLASEIREMLGLRRTQEGAVCIQAAIKHLIQQGEVIYGVGGLRARPPQGDA